MLTGRAILRLSRPLSAVCEFRPTRSKAASHEELEIGSPDASYRNVTDVFAPENVVFGHLKISEIIRSMAVIGICSAPGFADNADKILRITRICFGKRLFSRIMRMTAYRQFVAGDIIEEIQETAEKLDQCSIIQMLAVPIEDLGGESELSGEKLYEDNASKVLSCVDISKDTRRPGKEARMQLKMSAICSSDVLLQVSKILQTLGSKSDEIAAWMRDGCNTKDLEQVLPGLTPQQTMEFVAGVIRLLRIVKHAADNSVRILVDAEYTWINPVIQNVSIALMLNFNKTEPVVFKTYQAYLKETRNLVRRHAKECEDSAVHFAFKLVRGAYLLHETQKHGSHPPWICDTLEATNKNYNQCLRDALDFDSKSTRVVLATHNEESVRLAVKLLQQRSSAPHATKNVSFGQLFGMGDYMSFTLGYMGYDVYKSVPYGSVEDTLPYLCRRAKENALFLTGIRKEMDMLKTGLRFKLRQKFRCHVEADDRRRGRKGIAASNN